MTRNSNESVTRHTEPESPVTAVPAPKSVRCEGLTKIYPSGRSEVRALDGVDLAIDAGEFVCLTGPSGSGKTTLLNLIGGLDAPSEGTVSVDGQRLDCMKPSELASLRLYRVGFVFQAYNLLPVLSARENVEIVLQVQGVGRARRRDHALEALSAVGMAEMADRRPDELSGGQQQRVAVARAVAAQPALVLADEPTANLDSQNAEALMVLMRELNAERGVTFVISTHDARVTAHARRLVELRDGRIASDEGAQ